MLNKNNSAKFRFDLDLYFIHQSITFSDLETRTLTTLGWRCHQEHDPWQNPRPALLLGQGRGIFIFIDKLLLHSCRD